MPIQSDRYADIVRFYSLLDKLKKSYNSPLCLENCTGRQAWPQRGIYFFYENGENRKDTSMEPRVVRIGTHALKNNSQTTLWNRLSQHRGNEKTKSGNHRGSIFRLLVGQALIQSHKLNYPHWGDGRNALKSIRTSEFEHEKLVSQVIGKMPFLWLAINDDASPESLRGFIERNSIALLSNYGKEVIDPASKEWLGNFSDREKVRRSGLWNQNHVEETYDRSFLNTLEHLVQEMIRTS